MSKNIRGNDCAALKIFQTFTTLFTWRSWNLFGKWKCWCSLHLMPNVEFVFFHSLPKWVNKAPKLFQTFKDFVGLYFESYAHTTEMKKFRAGYFIKKMLDHFHKKINSSLHPDRNLWIYSAHDITISVFLNALGLYDVIQFLSSFCKFLVNFLFFWNF